MANSDDDSPGIAVTASTFWCHECEISIDLPPISSPVPVCPHCTSEFVEEMDAPVNHLHLHPHPFFSEDYSASSDLEDNELQFFNRNPALSFRLSDYDSDSDHDLEVSVDDGRPSPATKSSIDAVPTVEIMKEMIGSVDSYLPCAVCKDEFLVGAKAKRLPCSHIYHDDCIVPWLSINNTCPVCRSKLPVVAEDRQRGRSRWTRTVVRFGSTTEEEVDVVWGTTGVRRNRRSMSSPMLRVLGILPSDPRSIEYAPREIDFRLRDREEMLIPEWLTENDASFVHRIAELGVNPDDGGNAHHLDSEEVTDLTIAELAD